MVTHMRRLPDPPPARERRSPLPAVAEVLEPFHAAPSVSANGNAFPDYVDRLPHPRNAFERAIELGVQLRTAKEAIEKVDAAREFYLDLARIDAARERWEDDPEDIVKGVALARSIGDAISRLEQYVPDTLPWPLPELIKGPFRAMPVYIDAIGQKLIERARSVDDAVTRVTGEVRYGTASCQGGRLDGGTVKVIDSLPLDDGQKMDLFRSSCHSGFEKAMGAYVSTLRPVTGFLE